MSTLFDCAGISVAASRGAKETGGIGGKIDNGERNLDEAAPLSGGAAMTILPTGPRGRKEQGESTLDLGQLSGHLREGLQGGIHSCPMHGRGLHR